MYSAWTCIAQNFKLAMAMGVKLLYYICIYIHIYTEKNKKKYIYKVPGSNNGAQSAEPETFLDSGVPTTAPALPAYHALLLDL